MYKAHRLRREWKKGTWKHNWDCKGFVLYTRLDFITTQRVSSWKHSAKSICEMMGGVNTLLDFLLLPFGAWLAFETESPSVSIKLVRSANRKKV